MKYNIKTILAASCLMLGLSGCNDWLDVEPSTEVDKNALFKNEDGFADAMSGIYSNMTSDNLYGKNLTWYALELMGGGATAAYGNNASIMGFCFQKNSEYYMSDLRTSLVDPIWNEEYNTIANVNSVLSGIEENKGVFTGNDYAIFKGEALGLRAFLHFDLLRLFGKAGEENLNATAIPYVDALSSDVYPMLTVKMVADSIISDLKKATELLKADPMYTGEACSKYVCGKVTGSATYRHEYNIADWHNRRFHFNYYAALATMARVYQWIGDKENALACAKKVIAAQEEKFPWVNNTLVANVASNSQYVCRDRTFCTEQIFALNITDLPDRMDGIMIEKEKSFDGIDANIEGVNTDCFDASTRAMDPRYAYLHNNVNFSGIDFCISTKYYKDNDPNSNSPWSANRLPLIRLSEMYYIAAECEPDLAKAQEYLEQVRRHRGMSSYPLSCSSKNELQNEIEKEYRKEFIAEGQLFYYMKRHEKSFYNETAFGSSSYITPDLMTLPVPDDENTYGGRK